MSEFKHIRCFDIWIKGVLSSLLSEAGKVRWWSNTLRAAKLFLCEWEKWDFDSRSWTNRSYQWSVPVSISVLDRTDMVSSAKVWNLHNFSGWSNSPKCSHWASSRENVLFLEQSRQVEVSSCDCSSQQLPGLFLLFQLRKKKRRFLEAQANLSMLWGNSFFDIDPHTCCENKKDQSVNGRETQRKTEREKQTQQFCPEHANLISAILGDTHLCLGAHLLLFSMQEARK